MRADAIVIGKNSRDDVNVIIEVPLGGQPIKYEMNKDLEPGKWVKIGAWYDATTARKLIVEAIERVRANS